MELQKAKIATEVMAGIETARRLRDRIGESIRLEVYIESIKAIGEEFPERHLDIIAAIKLGIQEYLKLLNKNIKEL